MNACVVRREHARGVVREQPRVQRPQLEPMVDGPVVVGTHEPGGRAVRESERHGVLDGDKSPAGSSFDRGWGRVCDTGCRLRLAHSARTWRDGQ